MGRRKSKKGPQSEVVRTEDELRAEAAAREARVRERSEAATDALVATTRTHARINPISYGHRLFQPLWLCAVSLYGLMYAGWSPASIVVCFWFDKLARIVLVAARIYIHQVSTRKRGHFRRPVEFVPRRQRDGGNAAGPGTLFASFLSRSLISEVFSLIVMLWALHGMTEWTAASGVWGFIRDEWQAKAWIIVLPLVLQFVIETITSLRRQSFAEIRMLATTTYSASSIILPVFWVALLVAQYAELAILVPLVYLLIIAKTLYEVSLVVFGRDWEAGAGARLDNRLWGNDRDYARYAKQEAQQRLRDEDPVR